MKKDCNAPSDSLPQKLERSQFLWESKKAGQKDHTASDKPKMSFFQMAQAKRLEAENAASSENGAVEKPSTWGTNRHDNSETLKEEQTPQISAVYTTAQNSISPSPEPQASTSGCGLTHSKGLTCPVCFSQIITTDLTLFNNHIDQCLMGTTTRGDQKSDSESEFSSENTLEQHNSEHNEMYGTIQPESSEENPRESLKNRCIALNTGVELPKVCDAQSSVLVCPVCHKTQDTSDLAAFNHHVDICLNQEVLQKLEGKNIMSVKPASVTVTNDKVTGTKQLLQKVTKGKTKRRDSPSSPPSKKAKGNGPRNTIDRFLR